MLPENTNQWLGAYLYYNEPWEQFLVEAIAPYVKTVLQTGIAQQYFFVRYWDRGPHIRLRFKAEKHVIDQLLKPNLEEHFLNYFEDKPSARTDPKYPSDFPIAYQWLPNNSVQYIDYQPELERYAGAHGTQIAESQFHSSSNLVLKELQRYGSQWSYDDALGTAIKMHLSFVQALEMGLEEARVFFYFVFHNWLPRSMPYFQRKRSHQEYQQQVAETIRAFEQSFEQQKATLVPFHQALWEALEEGAEFEEAAMNEWIEENKAIGQALWQAMDQGQLKERPTDYQFQASTTLLLPRKDLSKATQQIWMLYADFIHMSNNRLGIQNRDEGYLAFLIAQSLEHLMK